MHGSSTSTGAGLPHRLDVDLDSAAFDSLPDPTHGDATGSGDDGGLDFGDELWVSTAVDPGRGILGRTQATAPQALSGDAAKTGADDTALDDGASAPTIGHVGRYALKRRIGEGGLGAVYAAHDPLLSRLVAIKTLSVTVESASRESVEALFLNEARAAGGLSHPHIVTVYDAGTSDAGLYIAMELLRGRDLRQLRLDGWRATPHQAALIVRRVAEALGYAHGKGVVHCDIKPANIFMIASTQPRVLDFGIARIAHQHDLLGADGLAAGSPYYMAPEQLRREAIDRRCDVYALGVVLYELLTGVRPFQGEGLDAIMTAVLDSEVTPAHELDPTVPPALSAIAARAMARNPEDRFRSARAMARELRQWHDDPASAEGGGTVSVAAAADTVPSARRTLAVAGALAAGVIALAVWRPWAPRAGTAGVPDGPAASASQLSASTPAANAAPSAAPLAAPSTATATAAAADRAASTTAGAASTGVPAAAASAAASAAPATANSAASAANGTRPGVGKTASRTATDRRAHAGAHADAAASAEPVAVPTGVVQIAVSPWGQVEVDGRAAGTAPPLTQLTLPEGAHTLVIRNDDAPAYTANVTVTAGQPVVVKHKFLP